MDQRLPRPPDDERRPLRSRSNLDFRSAHSPPEDPINCEHCGAELPPGAGTCPVCGKAVGMLTKTGGVAEREGEAIVDVGTKVGNGAFKLGGRALSGVGSLAKKAGKKLEGEEKK